MDSNIDLSLFYDSGDYVLTGIPNNSNESEKGNLEYFDYLLKEDLYNRDHYKFLSNFLIKLKAKFVDLSHRKDHDEVFKYDENKPLIEKEIADIESNYEIMKYVLITWDFRLYVENYWTVPELQSIKFLRLTLEQLDY